MSEAPEGKRRGGRAARRELRAAPIPEAERAVQPGMTSGLFQPLSKREMDRIHEAALTILETVGFAEAIPSCIELVTEAGGRLTDEGRLLFPRGLVEDVLERKAARNIVLCGQDPKHDMELAGAKTYFGTAGAAVHIADDEKREYRESSLLDLYDIGRLVDKMEHIHFYQRPVVARDLEDPRDLDFNTCYASVAATSKHVGTSWVEPDHVEESLAMLHMMAGSEEAWRARPFVSMSNCFVVPPMKFAQDACRCLEVAVRGGLPVLLLAAGQAGATSPAPLAGAIVQEVAEVLAGLVYVNLIEPSAPAVFGTWPFVSDLRTGAMSGGSGEQGLLMAACAQMGRYYDLPTGVASGMSDSKLPDAQAGHEKAATLTMVGNSGANLIYESAGMLASLLAACYESYVIDNDIIGAVQRSIRGIEVTDETLAVEVIRDVCTNGPGHFLGHGQTLALMQSEYVYPEIGDRSSPKEWIEQGRVAFNDRARRKLREILSTHYPANIAPDIDEAIRARFPVKLAREDMRPGSGRWEAA
jgi:trimethylamine--corrinoid protein Co-methyltransferase